MNEWEWHALEDRAPVTSIKIAGVDIKPGDRVRLCPHDRGDVFDLALVDKIATVESIEQDYEGQFHVSVVIDDDPGRDIGLMRQPGHRFFFSTAEIRPIKNVNSRDAHIPAARPTVLVAGIGNIFLGDDAFGVEVANRLAQRTLPAGVRVVDFGIRGLDLTYALIDGADVTILVDACPRGGPPGDLYVIEPDVNQEAAAGTSATMDAHSMNPMNVIRAALSMGGSLKKLLLVGCEPHSFGPDEGQMGLSEPVGAAVERAISLIESVVGKIVTGEWPLALDEHAKTGVAQ